ncbi:type VI secretion system contractile sheath small subunit [Burkholderia mayonis]|uniref:Type VI secretion protein n=1 Tax=Burkholderia mayonis TaxID=1385591 RepID=A0A1B4G2V5_9BURK|nr:type VI secretion system contractile sheath small subunit [Burkholderia mayonis]AOJ10193.1 type VI secretion protein [Burkholderia mayonis]KVE58180.1 type VI secretion protein [Burkholderia mayonis]
MTTNGSVAPKERVNIVYRPAIGDAKAEVELPLKVLVLGEFSTADNKPPLEELTPVNIDKSDFNHVMKAQHLRLAMGVPNLLDDQASEDDHLSVTLGFDSVDDFSPDAIVEKVPELKQLIALRDALKALKGPLGNIPGFRKRIHEIVTDKAARKQLLAELGLDDPRTATQDA